MITLRATEVCAIARAVHRFAVFHASSIVVTDGGVVLVAWRNGNDAPLRRMRVCRRP